MKILLVFGALILIALLVLFVSVTSLRAFNTFQHFERRKRRTGEKGNVYLKLLKDKLLVIMVIACIAVLAALILSVKQYQKLTPTERERDPRPVETEEKQPEEPKELITVVRQIPDFAPGKHESSDPENWYVDWRIIAGEEIVDSYEREEEITFGAPEEYYALPGISTFRGDNYRSGASYGTATVTEKKITDIWSVDTESLPSSNGATQLGGSGWTGQALVCKWDSDTKRIMNMYDTVREDVVEVIYATLDGKIYFLDLEDGTFTRDPIEIGALFKGSGAIDPRGYPLLYVGSGDSSFEGVRPRMYIISLIDGSVLYEYGDNDEFSIRRDNDGWTAFDSSPLVDAETDTLIWPGENGILYTIKLNTNYNKAAGTISVEPEQTVKTRYSAGRSAISEYWLGYECSAGAIDRYLYLSENGGLFYCVDLNTMELVWAQDTKDDSNSSPVIEYNAESGKGYIYTAPSLHWRSDGDSEGEISIYKLDAGTGEIVWEKPYTCNTVSGVSGGVQATPLLGKEGTDLEGLIIYPIARTPDMYDGILAALDTRTGDEVWRIDMENYTWSSPTGVYTEDGRGYIILCDSVGQVFLIDAKGQILDVANVGALVEASPVVYGDTVVVGTKGRKIYGLQVR
jgi:outer membrane protein assembly factor BamB